VGLFKQIKSLKSAGQSGIDPADADDGPMGAEDFEPIAGVSLELYAAICRSAGDSDDPSRATPLAAAKGVSVADWEAAVAGWNARIRANPAVSRQFDELSEER
jgi:hypothetical protein